MIRFHRRRPGRSTCAHPQGRPGPHTRPPHLPWMNEWITPLVTYIAERAEGLDVALLGGDQLRQGIGLAMEGHLERGRHGSRLLWRCGVRDVGTRDELIAIRDRGRGIDTSGCLGVWVSAAAAAGPRAIECAASRLPGGAGFPLPLSRLRLFSAARQGCGPYATPRPIFFRRAHAPSNALIYRPTEARPPKEKNGDTEG